MRRLTGIGSALAALWLLSPVTTSAELVVFTDGRVLKVSAFEVSGERAGLVLPAGGRLTVSLGRIERIVDDEILPEAEREEMAATPLELVFREGDEVPETPYGELIFETARRNELNPRLVAAVVRAESSFDPAAISSKGARGLMQLMPATADRFGVRPDQLFDAAPNLQAGSRYLKWLTQRYPGDLPRILAAYNAGEATVDRYDGVPPFRETRGYIRRIYDTLGLDGEPSAAQ